jgi:hypothetical protein
MPVVFLDAPGGTYWKEWLAFVRGNLLAGGMISPEDMSLFRVTESVDETVAEILNFYRVFHSMEYVNNRLVVRFTKKLTQRSLAGLQREFADILVEGIFRQESVVLGESVRPDFAGLSRLVFHFNRRGLGRLRQLIDTINAQA